MTCIPEVVTRTLSSAQLQAAEDASGHTPFVVLVLAHTPSSLSLHPCLCFYTPVLRVHRINGATATCHSHPHPKDSLTFHIRGPTECGISSTHKRSVPPLAYS